MNNLISLADLNVLICLDRSPVYLEMKNNPVQVLHIIVHRASNVVCWDQEFF